jgi:hypothetical protein
MTALEIHSTGAPPERHANRIVAEMMRHLATKHAAVWQIIIAITKDPHARDGNARAQAKLQAKVDAAGAAWTDLVPGKRGKYKLMIASWVGWDPATSSRILTIDDELDERPCWLTLDYYTVEGMGHGIVRYSTRLAVFLTRHALSRVCQRWAARTLLDLERVIRTLATRILEYVAEAEIADEDWHKHMSSEGVRLQMKKNGPVLVCKPHDKYRALVLVTVL